MFLFRKSIEMTFFLNRLLSEFKERCAEETLCKPVESTEVLAVTLQLNIACNSFSWPDNIS